VTEENIKLKIEIVTKGAQFNIDKLKASVSDVEKVSKVTGSSSSKQFDALSAAILRLDQSTKQSTNQIRQFGKTAKGETDAFIKAITKADRKIDGLEKEIKRLGTTTKRSTDAGTKSFKKMGNQVGFVNKQIKQAAVQMAAFVTVAAAAGGLLYSIKLAADFETGLVGVAKTTGLAGAELQKLSKDISSLARTIPVSTSELLELGQAAGQLGVKGGANILRFSEVVAKLGRTTDVSGEQAAQSLARIINVTGEAISSVDVFASVLVRLGNNVAATESQILRMTSEIARSTALFGVSSTDAASLGAAMTALGARAESAGSATGRAFLEIQNRVSEGGETLTEFADALGISGEVLAETFQRNSIEGFNLVLEGLRDIGSENIGGVLEDIGLGGQEIVKTLGPLAKNLDLYRATQKLANAEAANATALNEEYEASMITLNSQFKIFTNNLSSIATGAAGQALPALTESFVGINESLNEFSSNEDNIKDFFNVATAGAESLALVLTVMAGRALLPVIATGLTAVRGAALFAGEQMLFGALGGNALNTSLNGVSVSAELAAKSLTKTQLALSGLGAFAVGFSIGNILAEFEIVRTVTISTTNAVVTGWNEASRAFELFTNFFTEGGRTSASINAEYDALAATLEKVTAAQHLNNLGLKSEEEIAREAANALALLTAEQEAAAALKVAEQVEKEAAAVQKLSDEYQTLFEQLNPLVVQQAKYRKESSLLEVTLEAQGKSAKEIALQMTRLQNLYPDLFAHVKTGKELLEEYNEQQKENRDNTIALLDSLFPLRAETVEYNNELALLTEAYKNSTDGGVEFTKATVLLKKSHLDLFPQLKKQQDASDDLAKSWEEAGLRIDAAFANAWEGAFDSFEDFSDAIQNSMKKLLAELAHQLITKQLLINVGLGSSGGLGGGGGGSLTNSLTGVAVGSAAKSVGSSLLGGSSAGAAGAGSAGAGIFSGFTSSGSFSLADGFSHIGSTISDGFANFGATSGSNSYLNQFTTNAAGGAQSGGTYFGQTAAEQSGGLISGGSNTGVAPTGGAAVAGFAATAIAGVVGSYLGTGVGQVAFDKQAKSNAGATTGAIIGTYITPVLGTAIGAFIGGIFDAAFGVEADKPIITIKPTNNSAKDLFKTGDNDVAGTTSSSFGNVNYNSQDNQFRGTTSEGLESFNSFTKGVAELETAISGIVGEDLTAKISMLVSQQKEMVIGATGDVTGFYRKRFDTIFDAIGGSVSDAYDEIISQIDGQDREIVGVIDKISNAAFVVGNADDSLKEYLSTLADVERQFRKNITYEEQNLYGNIEAGYQLQEVTRTVSGLSVAAIEAGQNLIFINKVLDDLGGSSLSLDAAGADAAQELISLSNNLEEFVTKVANLQQSLKSLASSLFGSVEDQIQVEINALQELNAAKQLAYDAEMDHFAESLAASERLADAYAGAFAVGATDTETFDFNQAQYNSLLSAAEGGDVEAANKLADFAATFLQSAQANFASGDQFQTLRSEVLSDLENLSDTFGNVAAPSPIALEDINNGNWPELLSLLDKQNTLIENQRTLEEALFVQQLTQLALSTNQDLDTLLAGLGITLSDSVMNALAINTKLTANVLSDIVALAEATNQSVANVLGTVGLSVADLALFLDSNSDGLIYDELVAAGIDEQTKILIQSLDANGDGVITAMEAIDRNQDNLISILEAGNVTTESLQRLFTTIDADQDGILSAVESNGFLTTDLYEALFSGETFSNLDAITNLADLTYDEITDLISAVTGLEYSATDLDTLLALTDLTLDGLSLEDLTKLSLLDLSNLTTEDLTTIANLDLSNLTTDQLLIIEGIDFSVLSTSELEILAGLDFSSVSSEQLEILSELNFQGISAEQIAIITALDFAGISAEQLEILTSLDFTGISSDQLEQLTSFDFSGISAEQLEILTSLDFTGISADQLEQLTSFDFSGISAEQLGLIAGYDFTGISSTELGQLTSFDFSGISAEQLGLIAGYDFSGISASEIEKITGFDFSGISSAQLGQIAGFDFSKIDSRQLGLLSRLDFSQISSTQLAAITRMNFSNIDSVQLGLLSRLDFSRISSAQLGAISRMNFSNIDSGQLGLISRLDFSRISADQLGQISRMNFTNIDSRQLGLISRLNFDSVQSGELAKLSYLNFNSVSSDQLSKISQLNFSGIKSYELSRITSLDFSKISSAELSAIARINFGAISSTAARSFIDKLNSLNFTYQDAYGLNALSALNLDGLDVSAVVSLSKLSFGNIQAFAGINNMSFTSLHNAVNSLGGLNISTGPLISQITRLADLIGATDFRASTNITTTTVVSTPPPPNVSVVINPPATTTTQVAPITYDYDQNVSGGGGGFTTTEVQRHLFADGGIVTGPTNALIGEAGQNEAVIPLDNFTAQITRLEVKIGELIEASYRISEERASEHEGAQINRNTANELLNTSLELSSELSEFSIANNLGIGTGVAV
jgi:TP901 family phage tail tape measure protein